MMVGICDTAESLKSWPGSKREDERGARFPLLTWCTPLINQGLPTKPRLLNFVTASLKVRLVTSGHI